MARRESLFDELESLPADAQKALHALLSLPRIGQDDYARFHMLATDLSPQLRRKLDRVLREKLR